MQLIPALVHRNYVATPGEQNDVHALEAALRRKFTKRITLTANYFHLLLGQARNFRNALAWTSKPGPTSSNCT